MQWSYKTILFALKKEGFLGGTFLDETEMEHTFNIYGADGWELVSTIDTQDGVIAVFKREIQPEVSVEEEELQEKESVPLSSIEQEEESEDPFRPVIHGMEAAYGDRRKEVETPSSTVKMPRNDEVEEDAEEVLLTVEDIVEDSREEAVDVGPRVDDNDADDDMDIHSIRIE